MFCIFNNTFYICHKIFNAIHNKDYSVVKTLKTGLFRASSFFVRVVSVRTIRLLRGYPLLPTYMRQMPKVKALWETEVKPQEEMVARKSAFFGKWTTEAGR